MDRKALGLQLFSSCNNYPLKSKFIKINTNYIKLKVVV